MTVLHRIARLELRTTAIAAMLALATLAPGLTHAQGVTSALTPANGFVAPGAEFDVDFTVTGAGSGFNGFHLVVGYDPAAVTFLAAVPLSDQVGCLMNGTCSSACGATFHQFHAAGDSTIVDLSLLCDQVHLTGPGQAYRLHFQASATDQVTWVQVRQARFYDAGLMVGPVTTADARVVIGSPAGVGPGPAVSAWRVGARPNPARGAVALSVSAPADGEQQLDVLDLGGRMVRHLSGGWHPRGERSLAWDGTGAGGERLPAGVYLVRLRAAGHVATTRVSLLP
jgi:hypothetical protein